MADSTNYLNDYSDADIKVIETTYNAIRTLEEEKRSMSEDIKEEKAKAVKETGIKMKDLNNIFKLLKLQEKGFDPKKYDTVINKIHNH
jgi:uncharacterized protein (UPF0335 family)